jgi:hypothetical protein
MKRLVSAAMVMTLAGLFLGPLTREAKAESILWHNGSTGESQIWYMDGHRVTSRATVLGQDSNVTFVGLPWRIAGVIFDLDAFHRPHVVWHNSATNETQIWYLFNFEVKDRQTVLGENGLPDLVGTPWTIVGAQDSPPGIVWHNGATGEIQYWFMNGHRVSRRGTVLGEDGSVAQIGPPWSIVGTGRFNVDSNDDLLWHNSATGETQIWLMSGNRVTGRRTVLGENGRDAMLVGLPWRIAGAGNFDGNANDDIVWHNRDTGETQIWLMNGHQVTGRRTVLGENGLAALVGLPWRIVGVSIFTRDRTTPDPDEPR